jgi:uncharacterized protein (TIGR03435 family)
MRTRLALVAAALQTAALAQTAAIPPAFDVASVRVSQIGKAGGEGSRRENIQVTPDAVNMRNVSFKSATRWAFHVMDYQVNGPDWINVERYDINAKSATPVPEQQLRQMMQALLAERFKLATHRVTKELPSYVLTVGKNGPKFTESTSEGEADIKPDQKRMQIEVKRAPVSQLVDGLSNIFRAPVIDQTGLTGKYDITIDLAKYLPDFAQREGGGGPPPDPLAIITRGVQEELGLKLDAKKMPIDLVVIDKAEKVPVEN